MVAEGAGGRVAVEGRSSGRSLRAVVVSLTRAVAAELEPLWIAGLALECLLVGHLLFGGPVLRLDREIYEWVQYAIVGVVFPALLIGVAVIGHARPARVGWAEGAKGALVALIVAAAGLLQLTAGSPIVVPLAAAQVLVMVCMARRVDVIVPTARVVSALLVAGVAWAVAFQTVDFDELPHWAVVLSALVMAVALTGAAVGGLARGEQASRVCLWSAANVAGIAMLAVASLGTGEQMELYGQWGAMHHWGVYVGSAELIQQGHWLYWDIPSPYGLLSIVALAILPTGTPWQGLYVLSAVGLFLSASALFLALRLAQPGRLGWLFALTTTLASAYYYPILLSRFEFGGPLVFPSIAAYRFFWSYALIALLVWEWRTNLGQAGRRRVLVAGCVVWLLGVFWSPESALYASAVWLPAFILIVARKSIHRGEMRRAVAWLALPVVLFVAAAGGMVVFYVVRLGHPPDGYAIVEYILSFSAGVASYEVGPKGPAMGMLALFCLLAIVAYPTLRAGLDDRSLPLVAGLWGGFWATNTYFFARIGDVGMFRLYPLACALVALILVLAARRPLPKGHDWLLRVAVVPLLAVLLAGVLAAAFEDPVAALDDYDVRRSLARAGEVERRLPRVEPALEALFATAGARAEDPIVYAGDTLGNLMPVRTAEDGSAVVSYESWLPTLPITTFGVLPAKRKALYLDRFIRRTPDSGWFVQRKVGGRVIDHHPWYRFDPWLLDGLRRTHVPTRIYENEGWQLVWFEHVGDDSAVVRPSLPAGRLEALQADILIDGRPQSSGEEVWGFHGPGWCPAATPIGNHGTCSPARFDVFSPDARQIELRVMPLLVEPNQATGAVALRVVVNGGAVEAGTVRGGELPPVQVELQAGWNAVTLELVERNFISDDNEADGAIPSRSKSWLETVDIVSQ